MTDKELMQMALDTLEVITSKPEKMSYYCSFAVEIENLRARLAQLEPETLPAKSKGALSHEENKQHNKKILDKFYEKNAHLYTAPPQREWQGLTDDEMRKTVEGYFEFDGGDMWGSYRAIEATLKAKNG